MNKTFKAFICVLALGLLSSISTSAKSALVVAHYGSSDDATRTKTIDKITADIREVFPHLEVREAYISPIVRRNLAKRGINTLSPIDALLKLKVEGYDSVYVQSTTIIDGAEMNEVRQAAAQVEPFFSFIKVGKPLLYSPDDCEKVVEIIATEPHAKGEAVVYVGHGNMLPSTAAYTQLDYMLAAAGHADYHVSTIEGYPTAQTTIGELSATKGIKKVKLVPFLLVCGNHTKHDIAGDFASALNAAGYTTEVVMRGLAESAPIRQLYINRVNQLLAK